MADSKNTQTEQLLETTVMARCSNNYIGKEMFYKSTITNEFTKFKVKEVFVNIFHHNFDRKTVYAEVFLISENGNKYQIDEISEVSLLQ